MRSPVDDITEAVGLVPIVRLNRLGNVCRQHRLYLKLESCNPGGSIKEKNAIYLVKEAENLGLLQPGGTIIASSTGNFGIGLAMVGAARGYRVMIVVDSNTASPVRKMIAAFGAELVDVPLSAARGNGSMPLAKANRAEELSELIPGAWCPNRSVTLPNPLGHVLSTAKEIETAFQGAPDVIVLEVNAPDDLSAIAPYFSSRYPATRLVGVAVSGAVTHSTFSKETLHSAYAVPEDLAISVCHALSKQEGLLLGGSTGAIVAATISFATHEPQARTILMINPDRGDRYLDTIYNHDWLDEQGISVSSGPTLDVAVESLSPVFSKERFQGV